MGQPMNEITAKAPMNEVAAKATDGLKERPPTQEEINSAAHAATAIAVAMEVDGGLKIPGENGEPVKIAPAVCDLIIELLGHVSSGKMVTLVPVGAMLTTQEAADILNVSRPYLTRLLKAGEIHHEMVGTHRRVPLVNLLEYKERKDAEQKAALEELARMGQEYEKYEEHDKR